MSRSVAVVIGSVVAAVAGGLGALGATTPAGAAPADTRGVTRTTVEVGALLGAAPGADVGAKARFERENGRRGVAGRRIDLLDVERGGGDAADLAAARKLVEQEHVFAVVPVATRTVAADYLRQQGVPFVGRATSEAWQGNPDGFAFTGAGVTVRPVTASPAWGALLKTLLGDATGRTVAVVGDAGDLGAARVKAAVASVQKAGFQVVYAKPGVTGAAAPTDAVAAAAEVVHANAGQPSDVALLLHADPAAAGSVAHQLAALAYTGTVGSDALYDPSAPGPAQGMTVLTDVAPIEQATAANRRLVADVKGIAPDAAITPGVVDGYWSADLFIRVLRAVGKKLTVARFLRVANGGGFRYSVAGTIGESTWPAMHTRGLPCGALVQSTGTRYLVAVPYRCGKPIKLK